MMTVLWIAFGSALGGVSRYGCSRWVALRFGDTFPWGTLIVNVTGCFIIGFFAAVSAPEGRLIVSPNIRQFVMIGFCGGYTTFSSFSLQTLDLMRNGDFFEAGGNMLLSLVLCIVSVWLGALCAAWFNGGPVLGR